GSFLSPFLKIGVTFAFLQSSDCVSPVCNDSSNIMLSGKHTEDAVSFSMCGWMLSGPQLLYLFNLSSFSFTISGVTSMLPMSILHMQSISGSSSPSIGWLKAE
ncbi:unnamed protein product, partial [Meganyctiphanes norvegica]